MNETLLPYVGGVVAILSSFFGAFASGGSVIILLSSLFILSPEPYISLLATAKVAGAAMVLVSSSMHYKRTKVHLPMITVMTVMGLIGMGAATYLVQIYPDETFFERLIGFMLISFGFYFLLAKSKGLNASGRGSFSTKELAEVGLVLLIVSFINGFSGGMGMILTSYLILRMRMSFIEAAAYCMISGLLVVSAQAIYLVNTVQVNFFLLITVVLGSLLGGYFGTKMQYLQGNRTMKWVVTGMMFVLGTAAFVQ